MQQDASMQPEDTKDEGNSISPSMAALEAVLFLYGEPISKDKLCAILKAESGQLEEMLASYAQSLASQDRGLMLLDKDGSCSLVTKPQFAVFLENFVKESLKEDLTPAALETVSIIAYFGPISRAQIDYVRGVNSSFIVRNLLVRGLIERVQGSKGNVYQYRISFDFLKFMGIQKVEDMPNYEEYRKLKDNYFEAASAPAAQ